MQHGLQSRYYELNDTYRHSVRFLSSVPEEALAIRKVSVLDSLNNTSTDLTSQFYSLDLLPVKLMMATFSGYLLFPSAGYYTFRSSFESLLAAGVLALLLCPLARLRRRLYPIPLVLSQESRAPSAVASAVH